MLRPYFAAAIACLAAAIFAIGPFFPLSAGGLTAPAQVPLHDASAPELLLLLLLPLTALFVAITFTYRHLMTHTHAAPHAAGAANGKLSGHPHLMLALCLPVGALHFLLSFVQPAGGVGPGARELGLAALRALPAAATATFFLGQMLLIVAHIRAGGEGGGGDGPIPEFVRVLTKIAVGAAAALLFLMAMAVYGANKF